MVDDIVRDFGYLTLGSRLKRIGERLQSDVTKLSARLGLDVQAGQYPLVAALHRNGPTSVGMLARFVGVRQPAITRAVLQLKAAGLVTVTSGAADQRTKAVALTPAGHDLVVRAEVELWPAVEAAVKALCEGLDGPLLAQLGSLEDALGDAPLDERAAALINP
ncbi:MAG: MarR family transcriptional regulator [Ancalomicrobiaceae bacterium]|nr:MarR family transcriptional regulator [Ancalomicrobiaceae bacterium]